jgi:hypothetical protein
MRAENGIHMRPLRIPTDIGSDVGCTRKNGIAIAYTSTAMATAWKNTLSK